MSRSSVSSAVSGNLGYYLMLLPAVLMLLGFFAAPLAGVFLISVTEPQVGLDNYALLLTSSSVQRALLTTLRISALTVSITLVLGFVVAYAMRAAGSRQARWMLFCVLFPFWISVLVRSFAWITLLRPNGVINTALLDAGIIDTPLALVRNEVGVVIGMVHVMLPYAVLTLYASMRGISAVLPNAARGLGASPFQAFIRIFLPLTRPGIYAAAVLVFVLSLGFYITPAVLGGGRTLMIAEYVAVQINETLRWGLGTMLATTLTLAVLGAMWTMSRIVDVRSVLGPR